MKRTIAFDETELINTLQSMQSRVELCLREITTIENTLTAAPPKDKEEFKVHDTVYASLRYTRDHCQNVLERIQTFKG